MFVHYVDEITLAKQKDHLAPEQKEQYQKYKTMC